MAISANLMNNFNTIINAYGTQYILIHKSSTYDDYDQEVNTVSGSVLGSCFFLPVSEYRNGDDSQYLQEGVIRQADYKLFVPSGAVISGADIFVIGTGSYSVLRYYDYTTEGKTIYKKVYVRSI
jgi:hypothetical protein